jgi:short subunit dehydrogenase-like uncharacterized protein
MRDWMIYGVTGFTGRLIAEEAARRGWRPVLAGRSAEAVHALGEQLGLPTRVFSLDDPDDVAGHLAGMKAVLHCAGPFSATFEPMLNGCLRVGAHYLDITGELPVYEALFARHEAIVQAGITAISGVGFDVVPTDCLAAMLKRELPSATHLALALRPPGAISAGTAKTLVELSGKGGCVRQGGQLVPVPMAASTWMVPFGDRPELSVLAPLADVSTAFRSTGIPNIETYVRMNAAMATAAKLFSPLASGLEHTPLLSLLKKAVGLVAHGPSAEQRETGRSVVWGEAWDEAGQRVAMRLHTQEPYALTVHASLAAVERVLDGQVPPGALTPAQAFGPDFVLTLPEARVERL